MGSVYAEKVMGRETPKVALVNNGAEDTKGTPTYREAHKLLKANPCIHFAGNIEPRYIMDGDVDVVVCDGFVGNVVLKLTEFRSTQTLNLGEGVYSSCAALHAGTGSDDGMYLVMDAWTGTSSLVSDIILYDEATGFFAALPSQRHERYPAQHAALPPRAAEPRP